MIRWVGKTIGGLLLALVVVALQVGNASAATKTWTGTAGDHQFSTAGNWSPSGAPTDGDDLVFPVTASDLAPDNDISSLSVATVTFSGTGSNHMTVEGNALTITGGVTVNITGGAIGTFSNPVIVSGTQTWNVASPMEVSGAMSGSGAITKTGASTLMLWTTNSGYTGALTVSAGALQSMVPEALGATSAGTTVASGASLIMCDAQDVTFAEPLTLGGTGNGTYPALSVRTGCAGGGNTGKVYTFSGALVLTANTTVGGNGATTAKFTGALSGNYTITLASGQDASLELAGSSNTTQTPNGTYGSQAGTTTIEAGDSQPSQPVTVAGNNTYIIDGVRGTTTVSSNGTLKGTGTVGALTVLTGGHLAPGHSPGCLASGNLTINGSFDVEIGGTTACTGYDRMNVTGTVDVTGGTLNVSRYNNFQPAAGQTYTIINNDGADAVTGTFSGLVEGATFNVDGYVFRVNYAAGDGNDVVLTVVSVPAVPNAGVGQDTLIKILLSLLGLSVAATLVWVARRQAANI